MASPGNALMNARFKGVGTGGTRKGPGPRRGPAGLRENAFGPKPGGVNKGPFQPGANRPTVEKLSSY